MKHLALALLFISLSAFACRGGEDQPTDSLKHAVGEATYVFFGRIVGVREDDKQKKNTIVTLKPFVRWKGPLDEQVVLDFETGRSCDVGRFTEKGSTWLIVAGEDKKVATQSHNKRIWNLVQEQALRTKVTDAVGHSAK